MPMPKSFMPKSLKNGRYLLQEPILGGGMGEVYKGKDSGPIGRPVVVKLVRIAKNTLDRDKDKQDALDNFKHEVGILARARYKHIVEIYDFETEEQGRDVLAYMVMPYYEEKSLQDWFIKYREGKPLAVEEVAELLGQAGTALNHLHDQGIVHRDIKSTNFLVEDRPDPPALPNLLLADFGLAQTTGENISQDSLGTDLYKAPEQWANASPVPATDQYQLAIMAYYLLTGKHPFEGTKNEVRNQHIYRTPDAPSTCNRPDIPSAVDAVILRALKKPIKERYPSILDFVNDFRKACGLEPISVRNSGMLPPVEPEKSTDSPEPALPEAPKASVPRISPPPRESSILKRGLNAIKTGQPGWVRLVTALIVLIIIIGSLLAALLIFLNSPVLNQNALCDRNCVIDNETVNSKLKSEAYALQLQGNVKDACEYWYWASKEDPADGEARIAYQNYHFRPDSQNPCSTPINYSTYRSLVTVVYGDPELDSTNRAILQGVALRQQEFNDTHPNGPLLHIVLAKITGSNQEDVAQKIIAATKVKGQDAVAGVVGLPTGSETLVSKLGSSNIPMVSITPTDDTTARPFLLSVAPSFRDQADASINIIRNKPTNNSVPLKIILFYKSGATSYDKNIKQTFLQEAQAQGQPIDSYTYITLDDIIRTVQSTDSLSMIYLIGSSDDARQLQARLPKKGIPLQILGPADMYQWVYQNYTSEEMSNLVDLQFTAFAYHDAATIHDRAGSQCTVSGSMPMHTDLPYDVSGDYSRDFSSSGVYFGSAYTRDIPSGDTILAYDAISLMDTAGMNAGNTLSTQTLWNALQTFTPTHPFSGFSGQISFQEGKSAPYKKAVLLITISRQGNNIGNTITPITDTSATVWEGCYQFASQ